jgi:hypothetical protein
MTGVVDGSPSFIVRQSAGVDGKRKLASALRSGIISGDGRAETTSFLLEAGAGRRTG